MSKEIHFYLDFIPLDIIFALTSYNMTKHYINKGIEQIHTTSIANISFDLLDLGYRIFLHKNNKVLECKPGMNGTNKDIRKEHNILRLIIGGEFDDYFNF